MVAIDSNILAYLLLNGARTAQARLLLERDPDWHTDAFAHVELTNIFATTVRVRQLDSSAAIVALAEAQAYLGAALALGVPLVTDDRRLRKAASELTVSLADALAAT